MSDRRRRVSQAAWWLGAIELPFTLLWSVTGAGFYGSPLGEVTRDGAPIVLAILVLGGPLGLLPLAIASRRWPRLAGAVLVAGGRCAYLLAVHPWGLGYAAPGLYSDLSRGQAFAPIAFVTMGFGVALLVIGRGWRGWGEVVGLVAASTVSTLAAAGALRQHVAYAPFRTLHPVEFLAFGPDGRTLFAGGRDFGVRASPASFSQIDADTGRVQVMGERFSGWTMAPDRETIAAVGQHEWHRETIVWDTRTLRMREKQPHAIGPVALSADHAAVPLQGGVQIVALDRRTRHPPFLPYEGAAQWVAWSPDGGTLAIGRWKRDDVLFLRAPFVETRTLVVGGGEELEDGQYSPDGRLLAIAVEAGSTRRLRLWSTRDDRELAPLAEPPIRGTRWFAPGGGALVTHRLDDTTSPPRLRLTVWDTASWRRTASIEAGLAYAWSPDGATLALCEVAESGRGAQVVLRSTAGGGVVARLGAVTFLPRVLAFSPDGTRIAAGGDGPFLDGYTRGDVVVLPAGPALSR